LPALALLPVFSNRFDGPRGQKRKQIRANTGMPRPPLPTLRTATVAKPESTLAPAKVNLTLRIFGRRADGFHELESLVAFAPFGDRLTLWPDGSLDLKVSGPMAAGAGPLADNLVLRAARALAERIEGLTLGRFVLFKQLPSGAGLGGGSADAAAALRLIAKTNGLGLDDRRIHEVARATGADIPVCLDPRPRVMRGIGEILSASMVLPKLGILIVHPGLALPTGPVFKALGLAPGEPLMARPSPSPRLRGEGRGEGAFPQAQTRGNAPSPDLSPQAGRGDGRGEAPPSRDALLAWLASERNDLEKAAISIAPQISDILSAIAGLAGCRLARMSGSGSACFGLFDSAQAAAAAAKPLAAVHPSWWVRAGLLGN
jgi:4-diphosphocytidyl-2-C-methyl-D-erythritol kinase